MGELSLWELGRTDPKFQQPFPRVRVRVSDGLHSPAGFREILWVWSLPHLCGMDSAVQQKMDVEFYPCVVENLGIQRQWRKG